jgi:hypothetical protein
MPKKPSTAKPKKQAHKPQRQPAGEPRDMADILFEAALKTYAPLTAEDIRGLTTSEIRQLWLKRREETPTSSAPSRPPVRRKSRESKRLLSDLQIEQATTEGNNLLDADPPRYRFKNAMATKLTEFLGLPTESHQTVEHSVVIPLLIKRGLKKPRGKVTARKK